MRIERRKRIGEEKREREKVKFYSLFKLSYRKSTIFVLSHTTFKDEGEGFHLLLLPCPVENFI